MDTTEINEESIMSAERMKEQFFNQKGNIQWKSRRHKGQRVLDLLLRGGCSDVNRDYLHKLEINNSILE